MPNTNYQTIHQMGRAINAVVKQAMGRDAVQNIDMDHVTVAQTRFHEKVTVEGRIASFIDSVGGIPLEKCVAHIEPVQDLHGYSKPWAGGAGKNLFAGFPQSPGTALRYYSLNIGNGTFTMSTTTPLQSGTNAANLFVLSGQVETGANTANNGVSIGTPRTVESIDGYITIAYRNANGIDPTDYDIQLESGSSATSYEPYSNICPITGWTSVNIHVSPTTNEQDGTTYSITFPSEAGTVYGGTLDVTTGTLLITDGYIASYNREALPGRWISDRDAYAVGTSPSTGAEVVYELANPITYQTTPQEIRTLLGQNNIWANTGDIEVQYIKL